MKKYIHILTALTLLAASCAKSEVNYEPSGQVTLAPVKGNVTKAEGKEGALKTLAQDQDFNIYAFWTHEVEGKETTDYYIMGDRFTYNSSYGAWAGAKGSYPWPLHGTLSFAGYTTMPATQKAVASYNEGNIIAISDYVNDEFDFCWFGLTEGCNNKVDGAAVEVTLNHALTWITIKAYGEGTPVGRWKINSLALEEAVTIGKATGKGGTGMTTWQVQPLYDDDGTTILDDGINDYTLEDNLGEDNLGHTIQEPVMKEDTKTGTLLTDNIIIPQTPTNLIINYSYQVGTETRTDSKKVSLGLGKKDGEDILWESGKHYTYTLIFKSNDIQVAPSFGTWGSADQNITVE